MHAGEIYIDAGATATDDVDGDVTSSIVKTGTVNPNNVGTYTITYTVKDTTGNTATATRTINVVDNVVPTITFGANGNATYAKSRNTTVTVNDNVGVNSSSLKYLWNTSTTAPGEGSITTTFANGGTINTPIGVTGDYYLWVIAKDTSGNTTISGSNVFKLDNTLPVITVIGSNPTIVSGGESYSDAGATATSTRTVNVVDNILPIITAASAPTTWTTGNKTITVTGTDTGLSGIAGYYIGTNSTKPTTGSAWTSSTSTTWTVSRGLGTYYIWVKDGAGNISSTYKSVAVTNIDGDKPTCSLAITSGTVGTDGWYKSNVVIGWATKTDATSSVASFGLINSSTATYNNSTTYTVSGEGTTKVYGYVKDQAGNVGTCDITVKVDKVNPVISVTPTSVNINVGTNYSMLTGVTATDATSGVLTTVSSITNTSGLPVGTHTTTYTATDKAGNKSTATRTIVIKGIEYIFNYTGSQQTFTVPSTGTYKFEVWGAQGGGKENQNGGYGGYSVGNKSLKAASNIYIFVGGQGDLKTTAGYNGGGTGATTTVTWAPGLYEYLGAGGGAGGILHSFNLGNDPQTFYYAGTGGSGYIGGVTNGSMQSGVRSGNGYAKITYIGQ